MATTHHRWIFRALSAYLLIASGWARADNAALNIMLEENASAAAFARLCGDEPKSDLLKANTMLLLAFSGLEPQSIQLGSAKFNDILRQEIRARRAPESFKCEEKLASADAKLASTREALAKARARE